MWISIKSNEKKIKVTDVKTGTASKMHQSWCICVHFATTEGSFNTDCKKDINGQDKTKRELNKM